MTGSAGLKASRRFGNRLHSGGCLAALAALLLALPMLPRAVLAQEGLVDLMVALQTFTHKFQLALDHDNAALAAFYLHEMEEVTEEIEGVAEYDGHPVGELTGAMLGPSLERLAEALHSEAGVAAANRELDGLIGACNSCHVATAHGYIVIARNDANPYLQRFEPTAR